MSINRDLYLSEVDDDYSRENFRRIREELAEMRQEASVERQIVIQPHPNANDVVQEFSSLDLVAGVWATIYNEKGPLYAWRIIDTDGNDITSGLDTHFTSDRVEVRANADLENLLVYITKGTL